MFQETYNEDIYPVLHPSGPKHDYRTRLDSPEKACIAQYRSVNLGALLGLDEWRREVFYTALHAKYLAERYPGTDVAVSLPRIRPCAGESTFRPKSVVAVSYTHLDVYKRQIYINGKLCYSSIIPRKDELEASIREVL